MGVEFPPPRWAVPGIIAEGVNLLCGAPKLGKSWLALGLAVDVATGGHAFGSIQVKQGDALYLALEDTGRRLQNRLRKVLGDTPAPSRLTIQTACPPFPEGGAHIRQWLDTHPDARLVIVDVLAKMRGAETANSSAYSADYHAINNIKRIADEYNVAVLVLHHTRKAAADDFLDQVSGTHGIAGAADAILVLKRTRGTADGALHITGRDIDETEKALKFHPGTGRWTLLDGPAVEHLVGDTRAKILSHLREHPGASPKQIAEATGVAANTVRQTCVRMVEDGQLTTDGKGHYTAVTV
jgi:DNA-binding Lrp family transcriptional regulator